MTVFRKKKQLQRKKFLFLTENNVILIPFTNVHTDYIFCISEAISKRYTIY